MKYHIEKNTIQETLVIPLYARALCTRRFPHLFSDPLSVELLEQLDYDFSALERTSGSLMQTFSVFSVVFTEYIVNHPVLWNKVGVTDVVVFYTVFSHQLSGRSIANSSKHLAKLDECHHSRIFRVKLLIVFPVFHCISSQKTYCQQRVKLLQ